MEFPVTQDIQRPKRKRRRTGHLMLEGDDDSFDMVRFEDATVSTKYGPVTRRVEVPLRPNLNVVDPTETANDMTVHETFPSDSNPFTDLGGDINSDESGGKDSEKTKRSQVMFKQ